MFDYGVEYSHTNLSVYAGIFNIKLNVIFSLFYYPKVKSVWGVVNTKL